MEEERKPIINKTDLIGGVSHGCAGCEYLMTSHFRCIALILQGMLIQEKQLVDKQGGR